MTMGQPVAKKQPGVAGIVIGIILIVLGPVIGGLVIAGAAVGSVSSVTNADTYTADGSMQDITLTGGKVMGIWAETHAVGNCDVVDSDYNEVPLATSGFSAQTVNNTYQLVATFVPPADGTYTVECLASNDSWTYKVAPQMNVSGLATGLVVGIIIIPVAFIIGLVLLIVTLVRRSNWKKAQAATAMSAFAPGTPSPYQPGSPYGVPTTTPASTGPQMPYGSQPSAGPQMPYGSQPPAAPQVPYGSQPPTAPQMPYGSQPPAAPQPPYPPQTPAQ